ncbi:MAG: sugar transferase [Acidimicrobiales bacterium]
MVVGTGVFVLGFARLHASQIGHYDFTGSSRFGWAIAYIVLLCLASYAVGLPELALTPLQGLVAGAGASLAGAAGISLLQLVSGSALLPRFVVFWSAVGQVPLAMGCARLAALDRRRGEERDRVVAVVGQAEAEVLTAELSQYPERPAALVGSLRVEEMRPGPESPEPLVQAVTGLRGTVVVLDRAAQGDDAVVAQVASLHERGVRIRTLSLFYDEWLGKLPVSELERMALMFDIGEIHRIRYGRVKRMIDVVLALLSLLALVMVTPFVVIGDLLANRGPLFYRQTRVGKGGREFLIRKFRTMRPDSGPSDWTTEDDPRITPFGRLLRRSHLDELPQVLNILKGDLAVVGPRPEQPRYVEDLRDKIPFYGLRHLVRPGLTGWAQVKYPYGADEIDAVEKLQYEFYYLRHQGLALDARIIGRTLRSLLRMGGT